MPAVGVTVLTLSNGVEVWLKPTDYKADQVVFTGYAYGGASLVSEADYPEAALLPALVEMGGLGGLTPVDLEKVLAGRIASASIDMDSYTHGLSGSSTPKDLETALQLAYLTFTAPGADRRRLRPAEAALRGDAGQPAAEPALRVQREGARGHDLGPLHRRAA